MNIAAIVGTGVLVWFGVRALVHLSGLVVAMVLVSAAWLTEIPRRWRVWRALGRVRPGCGRYGCACAACAQAARDWDTVVAAYRL